MLVDIHVHERSVSAQDFSDLFFLQGKSLLEGVNFAVGELQLIGLVLFEFFYHGLIVEDQLLNLYVLVVLSVDFSVRNCEFLLDDGQSSTSLPTVARLPLEFVTLEDAAALWFFDVLERAGGVGGDVES